jgi:hypothetical protein
MSGFGFRVKRSRAEMRCGQEFAVFEQGVGLEQTGDGLIRGGFRTCARTSSGLGVGRVFSGTDK